MEGHVRLVDDAERTEEREQGVLGEEVGGVQPGGLGENYGDPQGLRESIITEAAEHADRALFHTRKALDLLAVVDREAADRKRDATKHSSELLTYLEEKT